ncbi:MAG: hypothetical protein WD534_07625 [Phycisphaeraceae bacterium]
MPQRDEQHREQTVQRIARDVLNVATLETRGRDVLDFHDLAVWQLRQALEQAYEAGRAAGRP